MLQLVLAMGGQGQIGWAATSMLPLAALGLTDALWRTANNKKLTTVWRSKQHCRYNVSLKKDPGRYEWTIIIEYISASGRHLYPLVIFKGKDI